MKTTIKNPPINMKTTHLNIKINFIYKKNIHLIQIIDKLQIKEIQEKINPIFQTKDSKTNNLRIHMNPFLGILQINDFLQTMIHIIVKIQYDFHIETLIVNLQKLSIQIKIYNKFWKTCQE